MATTITHQLEVMSVVSDMSTYPAIKKTWNLVREGSYEDLVSISETVAAPPGLLRIKKSTATSELVVEYIDLPVTP